MNAEIESAPGAGKMWLYIVAGAVLTLAAMVAAAYLWVYLYSVFIYSAGDNAYYEAYASSASPVVAVLLSFPVFYTMGRVMRRFGPRARFAAFGVVGINLVLDALALSSLFLSDELSSSGDLGFNVAMSLLSAAGKIAGAFFGSRAGPDPASN